MKEASEASTSGRATTIKAVCNGFYLWHWTVSVGTWGAGSTSIPGHAFYCSDRGYPPVCKPRINKEMNEKEFGKLCNGHDVAADFAIDMAHTNEKEWQSMHSGRPKPVRLQGQKETEPVLKINSVAIQSVESNPSSDNQSTLITGIPNIILWIWTGLAIYVIFGKQIVTAIDMMIVQNEIDCKPQDMKV